MDLKILRYFLTVANTKNITKAAELLHITQPTLSRQLIMLEESLSVDLFIREKRAIELTDAGLLLQKRAREVLDLIDKTHRDIVDPTSLVAGKVTIGMIESQSSEVVYHLLAEFQKRYPNAFFEISSGKSDDLLEKMEHGFIDVCLLLDPIDTSKFNVIRLSQNEQWGILVPNGAPLAEEEAISIKQLLDEHLILPSRAEVVNEIENWFGKNKYHLNIIGHYHDISSAIHCVEQGVGYPFCLNCSLIKHHRHIKFVPIIPAKTTQSVILWKKNRNFNSATEMFVKVLFRHFNPDIY